MKTMKWLLRRELWEHQGMFLRTPVIVNLVLIVIVVVTVLYGMVGGHLNGGSLGPGLVLNNPGQSLGAALRALTPESKTNIAAGLVAGAAAISAPLFVMYSVVAFFYCLGALYDERRDRSILFWKSLPISDELTVGSKVALALLVAPLISIAVVSITALILALFASITCAMYGVNMAGPILSNPQLWLMPLQLVSMLPVFFLWALPTVGWLLLVSSWARSKVFLWAVGAPLLAMAVARWLGYLFGLNLNLNWISENIIARALGGLVPGSWFLFEHVTREQLAGPGEQTIQVANLVVQSWLTLANRSVWIGAVAGLAMLVVAMRMRRWRDEA